MPAFLYRHLPKLLPLKNRLINFWRKSIMKKFVCTVCGYVYEGEDLPEDYECPLCGLGPDAFEEEAE